MNTHTTHTTHTVASAPTLSEMRARKYAHAVDRNDSARRAHADALAVLALASLTLCASLVLVLASYTLSVSTFAFGNVGREVVRGGAWVLASGVSVLFWFCVRDTRNASENYKRARMARAQARAEMLSAF